jgi:hypothetical protein
VRHEEALTRLPDLLDDRDDSSLLTHVRTCPDCQRQLFLLGRIDRLLRQRARAQRPTQARRITERVLLAAAAVAAAAAAILALVLPHHSHTREFALRTASGQLVGEARLGRSDARNVSLALTARDLPVDRGDVFVLWAGAERSSMQVGRFMVDRSGGCRVRFTLPATHSWRRFWVTGPGQAAVVAST